ncbi:MAG: dihydroflavonol-4-reductase [Hyphomicrobiaceae bacterium]|jgi:dihydroflavonol-4-reductase
MSDNLSDTLVLVTGASGFIAGHCVQTLLADGYRVRGTVRSLANRAKVGHLDQLGTAADDRLELVEADLTSDQGWDTAVSGCTYVLHVASPFPSTTPDDEMELIGPAVEGTQRVLAACARGGVKRVVLTSSVAAVAYGHASRPGRALTEEDWSNPDGCEPYAKSKTLAERAAWDLVAALGPEKRFELAVINPGFVLGPMLSNVGGTSAELIKRLLKREMPACPELGWATVDVRDLARAHVLAMTTPAAAGNRYICAGDNVWLRDMARALSEEFAPLGYRVPTGHLPYWVMWLGARFDKTMRMTLSGVGRAEQVSNAKARRDLGWKQRDYRETLVDMGHRAIELGMLN